MSRQKTKTCVARENGRECIVTVSGSRRPDKIHIDAMPFTKLLKRRCDYAIQVFSETPQRAFFFVELKGGHVEKAAKQLLYTIEHLNEYKDLLDYIPYDKRYACIVASCMPPTTQVKAVLEKIKARNFVVYRKSRQLSIVVAEDGSAKTLN